MRRYMDLTSPVLRKRHGEASLRAMRRIAGGGDPTEFTDTQNEALREIGWMHGDRDYFDYTDGCANCGRTYNRDQVLLALAFVAAISIHMERVEK